jgi:hypothetical protein
MFSKLKNELKKATKMAEKVSLAGLIGGPQSSSVGFGGGNSFADQKINELKA